MKKKARKGYQGHVAVKKELFECTYYNTFFLILVKIILSLLGALVVDIHLTIVKYACNQEETLEILEVSIPFTSAKC